MNDQERKFAEEQELMSMLSVSEVCFTEDQNSRYEFLLHIDDFEDESEVIKEAGVTD